MGDERKLIQKVFARSFEIGTKAGDGNFDDKRSHKKVNLYLMVNN